MTSDVSKEIETKLHKLEEKLTNKKTKQVEIEKMQKKLNDNYEELKSKEREFV